MSIPKRYQYPGGPITTVRLLFGHEFLAENPDRATVITDLDSGEREVIPIGDEIICDSCNAGVEPDEMCALSGSRLYCMDCYKEWIEPYLLPEKEA